MTATGLLTFAVLTLSSCSFQDTRLLLSHQIPRTQEEAGTTHIAVLSVAPWEEARESLQPTFSLTEAQALEIAGASTQAFEEKVVDALEMMVKLAPPTASTSEVRRKTSGLTDNDGNPLPSYTSDRTDTRTAGALGDVPGAPATAGLTDLPAPAGTSPLTKTLALEPMLKYAAATAMFQEVKLLNSYVKTAVQKHGYKAFVVRLQVSLMPSARKQPVDAYSTFSFFVGEGTPGLSSSSALRSDRLAAERYASFIVSQSLGDKLSVADRPLLASLVATRVLQAKPLEDLAREALESGEDTRKEKCSSFLEAALSDQGALDAIEEFLLAEPERGKELIGEKRMSVPRYLDIASSARNGFSVRSAVEDLDLRNRELESCLAGTGCSEGQKAALADAFESSCLSAAVEVRAAILEGEGGGSPFVVPLLVTDDLELSAQARALNQARQFTFGLAAMVQGFGGSVASSRTARRIQALTGNDINSLVTVARVTDNTMRVRFGAMQQASAQYAMVPRTNNVTLLLLVPGSSISERPDVATSIQVVEQTSVYNALDGKLIGRDSVDRSAAVCSDILDRYSDNFAGPIENCPKQELLNMVFANDYLRFEGLVRKLKTKEPFPYQQLWLDFAAATARSAYASTHFELPMVTKPQFFCEQAGVIRDDGKAVAKVALRRGGTLTSKNLGASLIAYRVVGTAPPAVTACDEFSLPGSEAVVSASGRDAVFVFPSAKALGLSYTCEDRTTVPPTQKNATLELSCPACDSVPPKDCSRPPSVAGTVATYKLLEPPAAATAKAADPDRLAMTVWPDSIVADAFGRGTLTLHFEKVREATDFWIGFKVNGGDVVGGSVLPAAIGDDVKRGIIAGGEQHIVVELLLTNLIPQASVTITAFDIEKPAPGKALKPGDVEITQSRRVVQALAPHKAN